ncbi:putative sugar (pentulose and hexulose) kinase [Desulforapulum autotrophicum HRM2]|uniref:Sugar (Pentulose and hexulose) kinase n=1 Tax=Desulforapulum autotrophicum (strain ATCC 43914 / DSM 3382 / VKM B-1955 / HRM2) TaxID=177437 RepID=C0Q930_DESAH|nr:FGGY family carbohydrate kinase [Desulforapulum autotrophicum]ACN16535.1 putative sugar (pentulose and hexulose) kinase [Desulforapulum autotrophicum HRM2]
MDTILTFDIGGSSLKAALFDLDGKLLELERQSMSMEMTADGGYEQDPEAWWTCFVELFSRIIKTTKATINVRAVCGAAMTRSQIFLDKDARPVCPAILWPDSRALKEGAFLNKIAGDKKTWSPLNEFHTLSRVLWLKHNFRLLYDKTAVILEPKDYINFKLTEAFFSDKISLSRILRVSDMKPDRELMEKAGINPGLFPEMGWPWQVIGRCKKLPAPLDILENVPVVAGGMDTWCSVTGTSASEGYIYNVSGTSEVTGLITRERIWRQGLVTLPWGKNLYQIGGPSQVGGDALQWFSQILNPGQSGLVEELSKRVETALRKKNAPLFIPYLRGERAPLWEDTAKGVFWNLHREHKAEDLIFSIMEGVAMANRYLLEIIFGKKFETSGMIISGGASKSDAWCQIKADVLDIPVVRTDEPETGLKGAFILAMKGIDRIESIRQGQDQFIGIRQIFEPDKKMANLYNRIYPMWKKTSLHMLKLHKDLDRAINTWQEL